jgi:two-component system OmpR family response regulator
MRILIAEDDAAIAVALAGALRGSGHAVQRVGDGVEADEALCDHQYDLLVLDLGLPGLDGGEVLRRFRARDATCPVLVISARDALRERVTALDIGADDYLVKPFALGEFEARIRALLRRVINKGATELRIGRLRIDTAGQGVLLDNTPLELTSREVSLLQALATRQERISSRAQLIDALCVRDQELTDNGLDIALHRLRRKLQDCGVHVRTVRGLGYLLEEAPGV